MSYAAAGSELGLRSDLPEQRHFAPVTLDALHGLALHEVQTDRTLGAGKLVALAEIAVSPALADEQRNGKSGGQGGQGTENGAGTNGEETKDNKNNGGIRKNAFYEGEQVTRIGPKIIELGDNDGNGDKGNDGSDQPKPKIPHPRRPSDDGNGETGSAALA